MAKRLGNMQVQKTIETARKVKRQEMVGTVAALPRTVATTHARSPHLYLHPSPRTPPLANPRLPPCAQYLFLPLSYHTTHAPSMHHPSCPSSQLSLPRCISYPIQHLFPSRNILLPCPARWHAPQSWQQWRRRGPQRGQKQTHRPWHCRCGSVGVLLCDCFCGTCLVMSCPKMRALPYSLCLVLNSHTYLYLH